VDTNVLDVRKLNHLKKPKNPNPFTLPNYEDAKYDLTEMWRCQPPHNPSLVELAKSEMADKPAPPKRSRLGMRRPVAPAKDEIDTEALQSLLLRGKKIHKRPKQEPTQADLEKWDNWED